MNDCNRQIIATLPQGDDFTLAVIVREGDTPTALPAGGNMIAAFYSPSGELLYSAKLGDGITFDSVNTQYLVAVSHDNSVAMVGVVKVEITTTDGDGVAHAPQLYFVMFEPRQNNSLIS